MPVWSLDLVSGRCLARYERTPTITLFTDGDPETLPPAVRALATVIEPIALEQWGRGTIRKRPAIVWWAGEQLLAGQGAAMRRELHHAGRRIFVPVHWPCLLEADLLTLEPRLWTAEVEQDAILPAVRLRASSPPPSLERVAESPAEPWVELRQAVQAACAQPEQGLHHLQRWRERPSRHPVLDALALRNRVVLLLRLEKWEQAEAELAIGQQRYPAYAEWEYLRALLAFAQGNWQQALHAAQQAQTLRSLGWVGSGGENSYRAQWVLGRLAELAGNQAVAVAFYRCGLRARPAWPPAVEALLRQRLPSSCMESVAEELLALTRREPVYAEPVAEFLLRHAWKGPLRQLLRTQRLAEATRAAIRVHLGATRRASRLRLRQKPVVRLVGPFFAYTSLARINRTLALDWLACADWETVLEPHGWPVHRRELFDGHPQLVDAMERAPLRASLTVRHHWPPEFRSQDGSRVAVILPWEYGAVPVAWVRSLRAHPVELWVPSEFVRNVFVACGVDRERIFVIPNGVDPDVFRPEGPRWRPPGCRRCVFLFVGGAIRRKGLDVLLQAYQRAFRAGEDVTLIIHDAGARQAYSDVGLLEQARSLPQQGRSAPVIVLDHPMSDEQMAGLYRGANALVLPYRGEGFALPVAEALACGVPVIVTAAGPALDYCPQEAVQWVSARAVPVPELPPLGPWAAPCTWFEPDGDELVVRLRELYDHAELLARRAQAASEAVRRRLAWSAILPRYRQRVLAALVPSPRCADVSSVAR